MSTMTAVVNGYDVHSLDTARTPAHTAAFREHSSTEQQQRLADFPRSASYTFMPSLATNQAYNTKPATPITIQGSLSEDDPIGSHDEGAEVSPQGSSGWNTPYNEPKTQKDSAHDLVAELHKSPKITISHTPPGGEDEAGPVLSAPDGVNVTSAPSDVTPPPVLSAGTPIPRSLSSAHVSLSTSTSFAKRLSRRLSTTPSAKSSRSPSPKKRNSMIKIDDHHHHQESAPCPPGPGAVPPSRRRTLLRKRDAVQEPSEDKPSTKLLSRRSTLLRRKSTKKAVPTVRASLDMEERTPAVVQLLKSFSTDKLPSTLRGYDADIPVPMPLLTPADKAVSIGALSLPRKRDELWGVFRSLDGDYTKFQSKTSALKANVVRTSLLPFLRNYADHPSSFVLRPDDLDRRANILNKWWTALLDMLHGRNNQSISGTDRPAILDGISGIMERPEWRLYPSPFCPLTRRTGAANTPRNKSSASLSSNGGDFLAESVNHNVRNMFIQNLNSQMAFVVDKMSLRNASASLVTFCGKATAYAFFFCPGIAEVLVRLWDTPTDTLRRVLHENGVGKFDNLAETSAKIVATFPPTLQQLGFCSLGKLLKHLRTQTPLPLGAANIEWYGFWLERWLGRESDLFYAFVKHYHVLVTDYLPKNTTKKERVCVPGLLLVHAQVLVNMDSTIHRDAGPSLGDGPAGLPALYDDVLMDPDAIVSTLPIPPGNAIRLMAENRLIMLIRDFLSERASEHPRARQFFAESYTDLLQACARRTSIYDHAACYTLCDFLEEALVILVRYENLSLSSGSLINSKFWLDVCKKMISSQNTMTEVRLFAFLYTAWGTITGDGERKADLCLGLLLDEAIFQRSFNHWCPMVRAYYMRLICWRVGRFDGEGEASAGERLILETLLERLRTVWSHYLWLKADADKGQALSPSIMPCNPAPGRRLLIIRTDAHRGAAGSFLAFDGILSSHKSEPIDHSTLTIRRHPNNSPPSHGSRTVSANSSDAGSDAEREGGFRGFIRNMLGGSRSKPKARRDSSPSSRTSIASSDSETPSHPPGLWRAATDDPRVPTSGTSSAMSSTNASTLTLRHRNFSFKFSLEFLSKQHAAGPVRLMAPRLPLAAQSYLQAQSPEINSPLYMSRALEPKGESKVHAKYAGRALAEWMVVVAECQNFFERRRNEGVPANRYVETPTLGVEVPTKRP